MKILDLKQGTKEWKNFRHTVVTASDIHTIMECGEKQIYDLLSNKREKKDLFLTPAMLRGQHMEEIARTWRFGRNKTINNPCVQNEKHPWFMASLDVMQKKNKLVVEIKCPEEPQQSAETYAGFKKAWWQIQGAFLATGYDNGEILIYHPLRQCIAKIERNEKAINEFLKKGKDFYDQLSDPTFEPQNPVIELDFYEAEQYILLSRQMKKEAEQLEETWKAKALEKSKGRPCRFGSVYISEIKPTVTYDYRKAAIDSQIDLSAYEKIKEGSFRVNIKKENL